jgi:hypothetical protein
MINDLSIFSNDIDENQMLYNKTDYGKIERSKLVKNI